MDIQYQIKKCIYYEDVSQIEHLIKKGLDPNFEGGWPIRMAARQGSCNIVRTLVQHGANPHLLGESGASTLQLAVFSNMHWDTDRWMFLLSYCDSSQLADGAAVAIIFNNIPALKRILRTGRCNANIPTTLTGKTLEHLAKGYKLQNILTGTIERNYDNIDMMPSGSRNPIQETLLSATQYQSTQRTPPSRLSPSVARFFNLTANQSSLTSPINQFVVASNLNSIIQN